MYSLQTYYKSFINGESANPPVQQHLFSFKPCSLIGQVLLGEHEVREARDEERVHEDKGEWLNSIPVPLPPDQPQQKYYT